MVVILLLHKRIYREFPLFFSYQVWVSVVALGATFGASRLPSELYVRLFLVLSVLDAIFMSSILAEMSISVLQPVRAMLPKQTILGVLTMIGTAALVIWPLTSPPGIANLSNTSQYIIHLDLTTSMLRILFLICLTALSHFLSIGWRDRVVQISTGFGFFSFISLCVTFLHINQGVGDTSLNRLYHVLDQITVCAYISSMLYWLVCFAHDVPNRQEFTPQMQAMIGSVVENARSIRLAMGSPQRKN